jgi:hypothetical protein
VTEKFRGRKLIGLPVVTEQERTLSRARVASR